MRRTALRGAQHGAGTRFRPGGPRCQDVVRATCRDGEPDGYTGGKAPLVVLDDADLDEAAAAANFGAFMHQGQICMSTERIVVQKPIVRQFLDRLAIKARGLKVGDPANPETQIGSMVNERSAQRVQALVKDAMDRGARIICGGEVHGTLFQPTVLLALSAIAVLAWAVVAFNRLVRLRNQVRTAWADIDVQLVRRHDLVPMLVAAVQGYAGHERALLEAVTSLRSEAMAAASRPRLAAVEDALEQALGRLVALQEAYPDLKASDNFALLQRDLVDVEEHLQYARRFYNGAVRDYNDATQRIPDLMVARGFGFDGAEFFQAGDSERAAPAVELRR